MKKSFSYNSLGNISSMEYSAGDNKTGFSYVYDNNFNITSRTSLDTNKTSSFTYDQADRLSRSEMHGAFATQENLDNGKLSQIDCDLSGTKDAAIYFEELPQEIKLDASACSFIYNFKQNISVNRIELFPDTYIHRVRERDILIYYKENENSDWVEINNWKFTKNEQNGSLHFVFIEAVSASMIKVRSTWDDRNFQNESIDTKATFKGQPKNLLRIWKLEESRSEAYEYDYNSNRKSLSENDNDYKYLYYTNTKGGNTARVMYDGKWWYTYDDNGNRTSRALNAIKNSNNVIIDVNKEYWTYTWDFWNRLTEVRQYNAPDNAQNVLVEYTYDVLNHRIERISKTKGAEEKTQYAYGRNGAITYQKKTVGNTVTTRSYTYLNNQVVGFTDKEDNKENEYYTVTDIQGSVTEVYDKDNKLVWKSGYTAFGIKAGETTCKIDFDGLYTGCDYDVETGLTYHWNRWRSEDGSFWLSEDPARDGANWYGYCNNNPLVYTDPNGLFSLINKIASSKFAQNSVDKMQATIDAAELKIKNGKNLTKKEIKNVKNVYKKIALAGKIVGYKEASELLSTYISPKKASKYSTETNPLNINAGVYSSSEIVKYASQEMTAYIMKNYDFNAGETVEYSGADILKPTKRDSATEGNVLENGYLIAEQNNTRLKTTDHRFNLQAIASLNETGNLNITWKVNSLYDFDSYTGNPSIDSTRVTKLSFQGLTLTIDDGLSSYLTTVGTAQEFYTEAQWGCTK